MTTDYTRMRIMARPTGRAAIHLEPDDFARFLGEIDTFLDNLSTAVNEARVRSDA